MPSGSHPRLAALCLALVLGGASSVFAQIVKGKVVDSSGEPVAGATVQIQGTTIGTVTDINGNYELNNVDKKSILVYSFMGLDTQTVAVGGKNIINVTMTEDAEQLDETVVIGYGTVKKSDLTGAVSVVKPDEFKNKSNATIGDALQGLAAGVNVRATGEIGGVPSIQIRGTGNLTNNDPLYVIDGMPTTNDLNFNTNDIESIQILKDASAAAIYGSRAANGVVIITTKKGREGKTKFEFNSQLALQTLPRLDMAGATEWKKLYDEAFDNAIALGIEGITARMDHWNNDTDWQDAYFKTGVQQSYDLSFSGGNQTGNYRTSFNYANNSGTTIRRRMERYTLRVNSSGKKGRLSFGENVSVGLTNVSNAGGGAVRKVGGSLADVVRMIPTIPVYDDSENGSLGGFGIGNLTHARALGANPVATSYNGGQSRETMFIRGTAYAELEIMPWLKYKLNLGSDIYNTVTESWSKGYAVALNTDNGQSSASSSTSRMNTYLVENTLTFDKKLGKHHIDAVLGMTYQNTVSRSGSGMMKNLIKTAGGSFLTSVSSGTSDPSASGDHYQAALISYLGRVNYDYDGRYLLSLTGRIDGSSRFADGYRWGAFPSFSAGWRISKEKFFDINWINDLKLRANWGNLGSQNVGYYDYQMFVNSYCQYLFDGSTPTNGQINVKLSNQDLTWERLEQTNFGVDLAVLDNRLQVTGEYFISKSHDVLTSLDLLMTTGNGGGNPFVNAASIENKGFELTATWRDRVGDFNYSVSLNASHSSNKLTEFGYGKKETYLDNTVTRVGEPIGMFYLIKTDGIFQSQEEVNNYRDANGNMIQPTAGPGDFKYIDANGDGKISIDDRQICGSPWADLEMGLSFNAEYKGFDFALSGFGRFGQKAYNFNRWYMESFADCNSAPAGYDYWTPSNPNSSNPRLIYGDERNSYTYIDRWLEDASFFRLSTMSVGYTWKPVSLKKYIDQVHVGVTAQNLATITSYTGYDPDFQGTLFEPGMDYCTYPSPRSFIFSLNVQF